MPMAVVGTPDEAAAKIQALVDQSGGFGCFLFMAHNWANWDATKRSYELFARYVAPKFQNLNVGREASMAWVKDNKADFTAASMGRSARASPSTPRRRARRTSRRRSRRTT